MKEVQTLSINSPQSSKDMEHYTYTYTYKIQLKEDAVPIVYAPRRVPAPLRAGLKKELERMTQMGAIKNWKTWKSVGELDHMCQEKEHRCSKSLSQSQRSK